MIKAVEVGRRYWFQTVPVVLAIAYCLYTRVLLETHAHATAGDVIAAITASTRLQLWVVLPVWLFASSTLIDQAATTQLLVRHGTWVGSILAGLRAGLRQYVASTGLVVVGWLAALIGTYQSLALDRLIEYAARAVGLVIAVAAVLVFCFSATAFMFVLSMRRWVLVLIPLVLFVWAVLSDSGVIDMGSVWNTSAYLRPTAQGSNPSVLLILASAVVSAFAAMWLAANWKDERSRRTWGKK